jgi:hypothetical protein
MAKIEIIKAPIRAITITLLGKLTPIVMPILVPIVIIVIIVIIIAIAVLMPTSR